MTFFNTQQGPDIGYRLQFETDDKDKFLFMQEQARKCVDNRYKDNAVRRGHWIPSPDVMNPIRCSECNMPAPFAARENEFGDFEICRYPSSYCHECGAKMDGKENE